MATHVQFWDQTFDSAWIVGLLSSSSELAFVHLQSQYVPQDFVEYIPFMHLPKLNHPSLIEAPRSTGIGSSSLFFKNLNVRKLSHLNLWQLNPKDLSHLDPKFSPHKIVIGKLISNLTSTSPRALASSLLKSIEGWNRLQDLVVYSDIEVHSTDSSPAEFSDQLFRGLSPFSKESLEAKFIQQLLLPNLRSIEVIPFIPNDSRVVYLDGRILASFVASRIAASKGSMILQLLGLLQPGQTCTRTSTIRIYMAAEADESTIAYLNKNVKDFDVR